VQRGKNSPEVKPARYRLPDGVIIDICRDIRNADNDYLIDREMQHTQNFTGIPVIRTQDTAMTESVGGIVDRSQEHLGTTDVAVIAARRRLIKMARDLEEGIEPVDALQPEIYNVRAVDMVCPEDDFFRRSSQIGAPRQTVHASCACNHCRGALWSSVRCDRGHKQHCQLRWLRNPEGLARKAYQASSHAPNRCRWRVIPCLPMSFFAPPVDPSSNVAVSRRPATP
jgi:LigXa C-terminal domain like